MEILKGILIIFVTIAFLELKHANLTNKISKLVFNISAIALLFLLIFLVTS